MIRQYNEKSMFFYQLSNKKSKCKLTNIKTIDYIIIYDQRQDIITSDDDLIKQRKSTFLSSFYRKSK